MQEIKMNGESRNIIEDNIEKLKEIFPEVFNEDKIDFEKLQNVLGNYIDTEEEKYRFTWNGKMNSLRLSQIPSTGTLRPCKEESKDWDTTQNLYIEGDNLEVLKLLQNSYLNKIKMIYIDPPYNTGKDFIYKDNFQDNIENYKKITGQVDSEGNATSTNKDTDGRYHTNWLNMMYPRLRLARNLLSDDGVIFISIDDNEVANLKKVCDEIFGGGVVCIIPILSNPRGRQSSAFIAETHEYLVVYAKNINSCIINGLDLTEEQKKEYNQSDENGNYRLLGLRLRGGRATAAESPTLHFPIYYSKTKNDFYLNRMNDDDYEIIPKFEDGILGTWRWSKEKILKEKNMLVIKPVKDRYDVFQKDYLSENKKMKAKSLWDEKEINYDRSADELKALFGNKLFDYAKPIYLLNKIITLGMQKDSTILDFFSGSSTTAHAVMQLNAEDNGNRKFIMVQLPEVTDEKSEAFKNGYKNICEIGKERIRRAGEKIKEEIEKENQKLMLGEEPKKVPDIGFKVFKLDTSNIRKWNPYTKDLESILLDQIENFIEGRSEEDVLYEIILKYGLDLTVPIEEINMQDKKVYSVGYGALIVCLDDNITLEVAYEIAKLDTQFEDKQNVTVVFKDNGFASDSVKTNIKEILRNHGIRKFVTM